LCNGAQVHQVDSCDNPKVFFFADQKEKIFGCTRYSPRLPYLGDRRWFQILVLGVSILVSTPTNDPVLASMSNKNVTTFRPQIFSFFHRVPVHGGCTSSSSRLKPNVCHLMHHELILLAPAEGKSFIPVVANGIGEPIPSAIPSYRSDWISSIGT
jgi:hypothetical protein